MERIDVVLTGRLLAGTDFATAVEQLAALTKLDRTTVAHLLQAGAPRVVKRNVGLEVGERYRAAFTAIGVEVALQPSGAVPAEPADCQPPPKPADASAPQPPPPEIHPTTPASDDEPAPSLPTWVPENSELASDAPAAAAKSAPSRDRAYPPPDKSGLQSRQVPASHGWLWIKEAADLYMDEQVLWTSMPLFLGVFMTLISLLPIVGSLCSLLTGPVFAGGLMLAAHGQQQGEGLHFLSLFQGFRHNRNQLLLLGVLQLLMAVGVGVVAGIGAVMVVRLNGPMEAASLLADHPLLILLLGLAALTLAMAVSMAFWFAPCLVAIGNATAWESIGISFRSTLRNWSAFFVFALVAFVAVLVAGVVLVLAGMLLQFALVLNMPQVLLQIAILALLSPIIALFTLTTYTAFRDLFLSRS